MKITQSKQQKEKQILNNENSLKDLWDNTKHTNIHIIEVSEGEEREKGKWQLFKEKMAKSTPNLGKKTGNKVQEAQSIPNKMNSKRFTPRHILTKLSKVKDKEF